MLDMFEAGDWAFSNYMTNTVGHDRRFGYLYDSSVPYDIPESDYENITTDNEDNNIWENKINCM